MYRIGCGLKLLRSHGFPSPPNHSIRSFHCWSPLLSSAKKAKDLIKLVNSSSLTRKEEESHSWKTDPDIPEWKRQKMALRGKLKGENWNPKKRLSRDEIESVRLLRQQFPQMGARELGEKFKISPEVIRRILKSKWQPTEDDMVKLHDRWKRRGERINAIFDSEHKEIEHKAPPKRQLVIGSGRSMADLMVRKTLIPRNRKEKEFTKKDSNSLEKRRKLQLLSISAKE